MARKIDEAKKSHSRFPQLEMAPAMQISIIAY
jgi:hypothetical protein